MTKKILETDYKVKLEFLETLASLMESDAWNHSVIEQECATRLACEKISNVFSSISKDIFCAYYIAKKLNAVLNKSSSSPDFLKDLNEILTIIDSKDLEYIAQFVSEYIKETYSDINHSITAKQILNWLEIFNSGYRRIEWLLLKSKLKEDLSACPMDSRQSLLILEHYGKKMLPSSLSLGDLQNRVVNDGLEFGIMGHPVFKEGAKFTIIDILQQNLDQLIAWYLTKNIMGQLPVISNDSYQKFEKAIFQYCQLFIKSCFVNSATTKDIEIGKNKLLGRCRRLLKKVSRSFQDFGIIFDVSEQPEWLYSILCIYNTYYQFHPLIEKKAILDPKAKHEEECIVIYGDSVSAGYLIPQSKKRWANILSDILEERGFHYKVINRSIVGYELAQALTDFEKIKHELSLWNKGKPCIVLVTLCGNDVLAGKSIEDIRNDLGIFVDKLKSRPEVLSVHCAGGLPADLLTEERAVSYEQMFKPMVLQGSDSTGLTSKEPQEIISVDDPRSGVITSLLPKTLLRSENMHGDGLHPKGTGTVQYNIALQAFRALEPVLLPAMKQRTQFTRRRRSLTDLTATATTASAATPTSAAASAATSPSVHLASANPTPTITGTSSAATNNTNGTHWAYVSFCTRPSVSLTVLATNRSTTSRTDEDLVVFPPHKL